MSLAKISAMPSSQRGGLISARDVVHAANRLIEIPSDYVVKLSPLQKVLSLDKQTLDKITHSSLAVGAGGMIAAGGVALATGDGSYTDVSGTILTGVLNMTRNLWQMRFLSSKKPENDVSTPEGRQKRRKKQIWSNILSARTNLPQLIEGRLVTAGSAVTAYSWRAVSYYQKLRQREQTNVLDKTKELENDAPDSWDTLNQKTPSNTLKVRGMGQAGLSVPFTTQFGIVPGIFTFAAGLCQIFGAVVMHASDDKKHSLIKNEAQQNEPS